MKVLLIGGCGFIGFNVFQYLNNYKLYKILIVDNLSGQSSKKNYKILKKDYKKTKVIKSDISNYKKVSEIYNTFKPDAILALHGQVAVTKSIQNPSIDLNNNFLSLYNLLNIMREKKSKAKLINLSSNKVYGKIENLKLLEKNLRYHSKKLINENYSLKFESPYACSKGSADQYLLDHAKLYKLNAVSLRLSCVYGENQWGSEDQGWISWIIKCALLKHKIRIFGNGKQVRDILHVKDLSNLINLLLKRKNYAGGQAFNIGGGKKNTLSILELIKHIEKKNGQKVKYRFYPSRFGDQKYFVNDLRKIKKFIGWSPKININEGLSNYINWIKKNNNEKFR